MGGWCCVGAPLGNPGDASARLREVLATADVVAAEDTRRLARLARDLGVTVAGRVVSYFEGNEERRTPDLVEALRGGARVALITDGGMPSVSDPGYRLVRAALDAGVPVTARARPERGDHRAGAVRAALRPVLLRGLPAPRRRRAPRPGCARSPPRRARWSSSRRRTGSPTRSPTWPPRSAPDRPAAVCRELTKTYEEVRRGAARRARGLGRRAASRAARSPWSSAARRRRRPSARPTTSCAPRSPRGRPAGDSRARRHRRGGRASTACAKREVYALVHALDQVGAPTEEPSVGQEASGEQQPAGRARPPRAAASRRSASRRAPVAQTMPSPQSSTSSEAERPAQVHEHRRSRRRTPAAVRRRPSGPATVGARPRAAHGDAEQPSPRSAVNLPSAAANAAEAALADARRRCSRSTVAVPRVAVPDGEPERFRADPGEEAPTQRDQRPSRRGRGGTGRSGQAAPCGRSSGSAARGPPRAGRPRIRPAPAQRVARDLLRGRARSARRAAAAPAAIARRPRRRRRAGWCFGRSPFTKPHWTTPDLGNRGADRACRAINPDIRHRVARPTPASLRLAPMSHVLAAVAWPYANGPRHIGHVSGFGVPSDVFSRYMRMAGHDVLMVSGTDEHGTPILVQADDGGRHPARARRPLQPGDRRGPARRSACPTTCSPARRPRNHYAVAQELFRALHRNGYIVAQDHAGRDLAVDRPHPARPLHRGHLPDLRVRQRPRRPVRQLRQPARPDRPDQPAQPDQRRDAEVRRDRALLPRPAGVRRGARRVAATAATDWRPNVLKFSRNLLDDLQPRAITRDLDWGMPDPAGRAGRTAPTSASTSGSTR